MKPSAKSPALKTSTRVDDSLPLILRSMIKMRRKEMRFSLKSLAAEVGVSDAQLNHIEVGNGTAPLARVNGLDVAGKTGTSQTITPDGHYSQDKYVTSFAGFFPVDHPKYVCVVVVDQANLPPEQNYGGVVAAPVFAEVAKKISKLE